MALNEKLLGIYLNDHLAGSTVGVELAKRTLGANRGSRFEQFLERVTAEIAEDRATLRDIMRTLGVREDPLKRSVALVGERLGRLKLNGSLRGYSPLSRVVEFEGLVTGITGKLALWRALGSIEDQRLAAFDFGALAERAVEQRDGMEAQRLEAARIALTT
jgi:hypothetical protein